MLHTSRSIHALAAVLAVLSLTAIAFAQERPATQFGQRRGVQPNQQPAQRVTANRPVDGQQNTDQQIANWLSLCNEEEVALSKLAATKADDKKVREFAETLAKEHGDYLAELQKFGAQSAGLAGAAEERSPRTTRVEVGKARVEVGTTGARGATQGGLDFFEVSRQMAKRCIASAEKEWSEKKSDECDMAFVGSQIVKHQQMLNGQQVLREYASPALQALIDKGIASTEEHLNHAKDMINSMTRNDSSKEKSSN